MSDKIINTQENHNDELLDKQGVEGTAVGEKWENGKPTGQQAILVFVQKKHSHRSIVDPNTLTAFSAQDLVPSQIDGIPTDVIEVGLITKQNSYKTKVRPLQPGFSCGHGLSTAGTIGGIFLDKNGKPVILSNNHVIANENNAAVGDIIYQPGPADMPKNRSNIIGNLHKFVKIKSHNNLQDSAIAYLDQSLILSDSIYDIYPGINQRLQGFSHAQVGQMVQKCGRTTGYTTGRVVGLNASFSIQYDFGMARFNKCLVLSAMSKGGDSGSIIQDMQGNAVGLLFAGSDRVTIANPIDIVQRHYGLQLYQNDSSGIDFCGFKWKLFKSEQAQSNINADQFSITALKNNYCCLEKPISQFNTVSCDVNTGTDEGAAWAPGLSVIWPNGFIKINLRYGMTFGGYSHLDTNFDAGLVKPNTTYTLRIKNTPNSYIGEIKDGQMWIQMIEMPKNLFPHAPTIVRIGKTDIKSRPKQHHMLGKLGSSTISKFRIN